MRWHGRFHALCTRLMARPTSRDALGYPASSAIVPYVHTEPAGTHRTCAYTRSKNASSISIIPEPFLSPTAAPLSPAEHPSHDNPPAVQPKREQPEAAPPSPARTL